MNFDLCTPVTWSGIIEMGSIAMTFITAIIAIIISVKGNKLSKKQLQTSRRQLNDALQIHEKSKNVDLYDRRTNLLKGVQGEISVDELEIELLFNDEILNQYKDVFESKHKMDMDHQEIEKYFCKLNEYIQAIEDESWSFEDIKVQILNAELSADESGTGEHLREYQNLCDKYSFNMLDYDGKLKHFDYYLLQVEAHKSHIQFQKLKEETTTAMKFFIKESLNSINKTEE